MTQVVGRTPGKIAFEVFQPNRVEANNSGVARLRCNYNFTGKGEEFRITLFRGISDQTIVCASSFHLPNTTFETKEGLFSCQGEASRNSVDLTISGMSSSDTDFYKCRVEIMYPPPYRQRVGNGTVIYIPEIQTCPKIESSMEWIIVAVSGCIIACTVIIIAAILVIRVTQPHLVAANSSGFAILTCDYKYSKEIVELKIYLLRARHNDTISCETSVNESKKGSLCLMERYNNSVTLTISRLNVSDADLYVCRVEIRSPPPFVYAEGTGTIVYVAEGLNEVQHAVYRTAFKLRSLQKLCQYLPLIGPMLQDLRTKLCDDGAVSVQDLSQSLQLLFQHASQEKPGQVAEGATEHTVSLVATMFDRDQTGFIQLRSVAAALIAFSADKPSAKYTDLFQLAVQCSASHYATSRQVTRSGLRVLLQDLKQVLSGGIPQEKFTAWLNSEPQFLLWLSTLYRVSATEAVTHQSRCDICKAFPITGLRYRCLKCLNFHICQRCFLTSRTAKNHKNSHPVMEHCSQPSLRENLKVFTRTVRNNLLTRRCKQKEAQRRGTLLIVQSGALPAEDQRLSTDLSHQALSHRPTCISHCDAGVEIQPEEITRKASKAMQTDEALPRYQLKTPRQKQVPRIIPKKVTMTPSEKELHHSRASVKDLARGKRYLEEQLQLWKVKVQSELNSQEDKCDKLEAKIEVLTEHNKNLQDELVNVRQLVQAPAETRDVGVTKPVPDAEVLKNAQVESTLSVPNAEKPCGDGIQDEEEELFQLVQRLKSALSVKVQPGPYSNVKQELIEAAGYVGDSLSHLVNKVALTTPY
ncbi:Dystrotelin [Acipenser ruthenus]|uniref:Dystrotelin n=1 Tax=Acipenser ruthenus TaxID=7906 RepID=A0A444UAC3_ACIRT|nr:Dystrotelin [Acipenser ruthenus]